MVTPDKELYQFLNEKELQLALCVCVRVLAVEYIGQAMSFLMNPHAIQLQEPLYFSRILKCFITFDSEISFTEVQVWGKVCNVEPRFLHKILKVVL